MGLYYFNIMGPLPAFTCFRFCTLFIFVPLLTIDCQTTTKTDIAVYIFHAAGGDMFSAMNVCGNNYRYLPVINSERKRLWYATLRQKLAEIAPSIAHYNYMFWTNATSSDGFNFYFDNYPHCTELPSSSNLWSDRSFDDHKLGTLFVGPFSIRSSNYTHVNQSRYGLMPITPIIPIAELVMCEREAGPCDFEQKDHGTCPSPTNKEIVYRDVTLMSLCIEYCTRFVDGNFECWGILYTATLEECRLIITENPASLTFLQKPVDCGVTYPSDTQYHVKQCYSLSVDFDLQATIHSSLVKQCNSSGPNSHGTSTSATTDISFVGDLLTLEPTTVLYASLTTSEISLLGQMSSNTYIFMESKTTVFSSVISQSKDLNLEPSLLELSANSLTTSSSMSTTSMFDSDVFHTEQSPVTHTASIYSHSSTDIILPPTFPFITPSETVTTNTGPSLKLNYLRPCLCFTHTADNSSEEDKTSKTIKELKIDASKVSSSIRTKTTAKDERYSATAIGIVGVAAVVIPGFLIVFADIFSILCNIPTRPMNH